MASETDAHGSGVKNKKRTRVKPHYEKSQGNELRLTRDSGAAGGKVRRTAMLSDKSRPVIQATLPVVGAQIKDIAEHFYRHMFTTHPELLDGTFNRGNQAQGTQQLALAGSVAAFATALVKTPGHLPENLLARIAHKHASLGHEAPAAYRLKEPNEDA
jgi:hypothetical protein